MIYENNNEYSLCEIYNKGLIESKNNIVIFCHDDIIMERKSWGRRLIKNFEQNNDYGILGVAGTKKLNKSGIWWNEPHKNYGIVNHINKILNTKSYIIKMKTLYFFIKIFFNPIFHYRNKNTI